MNTLPICLVTGFLGSGKTTLLKRIAERHRDRPLVYLVNEFSPADVDGAIVAESADRVVSVAGGSIFCQCKAGEFINQLGAIHEQHIADGAFEGVVIEASGIADPSVVHQMLRETRLDDRFRLARVVGVVDPATFGRLVKTLPNIKAQVRAADLALLNKIDQHTEADVAATEFLLREVNPDVTIIRTEHCAAAFDLFADGELSDVQGEMAACADPNYDVLTMNPPGRIDEQRLTEALAALGDRLYRAKGFVEVDRGWVYVDHAGGRLTVEPTHERASGQFVVIVAGPAAGEAHRLLTALL